MLVISDRNKLFKLWWSREFLVINYWYFFLQPIRIPNINDQENIDANESDTDPQPTCLAPQKVLPGNTCGETYVFFQSVCCVSVMFKQIISPKSLIQTLGLKLCPKISRNVDFTKSQISTPQNLTNGNDWTKCAVDCSTTVRVHAWVFIELVSQTAFKRNFQYCKAIGEVISS